MTPICDSNYMITSETDSVHGHVLYRHLCIYPDTKQARNIYTNRKKRVSGVAVAGIKVKMVVSLSYKYSIKHTHSQKITSK